MKNLVWLVLIYVLYGCSAGNSFYNKGSIPSGAQYREIEIKMRRELPFCRVMINGKAYNFLLDTGAPTVISQKLFDTLGLKGRFEDKVADSQRNRANAKFTVLPSLSIEGLQFTNIGCVVLGLDSEVFKCLNIDGIIGANLMAKMYWMFDYEQNKVMVSTTLTDFGVEHFDFSLDFTPRRQKTPLVKGQVGDRKFAFTFDTGYNGSIKVFNDYDYFKARAVSNKFITKHGSTAFGVFGESKSEKTFEAKSDIQLGARLFPDELMESGESILIGNKFLQDYVFVIDWRSNKIYFKRNGKTPEKKVESFGFSYLKRDDKVKVVMVVEEAGIDLLVNDEILSIHDRDFTEGDIDFCDVFMNRVEKDLQELDITVKRGADTLRFNLQKLVLIE